MWTSSLTARDKVYPARLGWQRTKRNGDILWRATLESTILESEIATKKKRRHNPDKVLFGFPRQTSPAISSKFRLFDHSRDLELF